MKTIQLLAITLLTSILISSCGSGYSIVKRRYNKGFYVHHRTSPTQPKTQEKVKQQPAVATEEPAEVVQILPQAPKVNSTNNEQKPAVAIASAQKSKTQKIQKALDVLSRTSVPAIAGEKKFKALSDAALKHSVPGTALSLLWIVIVVILILYLLGILFDIGGGNGLIHILGVIILVLLILWLLRIL